MHLYQAIADILLRISTGPQSGNPPSLDPNQLAMLKRVAAQQQQGQAETTSPQVAQKAEANRAQTDTLAFQPDVSVGDLSQFDLSSFDPTVAVHWLRLAQQWHNTYQVGLDERRERSER